MKLQLLAFKREHLPNFLDICVDSYADSNPFLLSGVQTVEQFREETEESLQLFLQAEQRVNDKLCTATMFNTYFTLDGVIVRAGFSCELYYYLNVVCLHKRDQFFDELLQMDLRGIKEGTAVVSIRQVTHKDYYRRGLMKFGLIEKSKHMVAQGYVWDFVWTSNEVSMKVMTGLGAEVLKTLPISLNGTPATIYLIRRDMRIAATIDYNFK